MYHDLYDYDHPALFMHLVEQGAFRRARRAVGYGTYVRWYKRTGARKVRRAIRAYLRHDCEPRIDNRAAGDSWEVW